MPSAAARVASLTITSPPGATEHSRAATLTVRPYQSPWFASAGPVWMPTRTGGKPGWFANSETTRRPSLIAACGSPQRSITPSPIVFTCSAP